MTDELIRVFVDGSVGRLTFSRPKKRNAISTAMSGQFEAACETLAQYRVKSCVLEGEGPVFCSGADTADANMVDAFHRLYGALLKAPWVWVAGISGGVSGAGLLIVAATPIAVAGPSMWASLPEISSIQQFPRGVLERIGSSVSRRWLLGLALSGRRANAWEAAMAGLITSVEEDGRPEQTAIEWARAVAKLDQSILSDVRNFLRGRTAAGVPTP